MITRITDFLNRGLPSSSSGSSSNSRKSDHSGQAARLHEPAVSSGAYCSLDQLMQLRLAARTASLPKAKKVAKIQSGSHHSRFRGRGMEFSEVREYQPGDDIRSIDWKVTARRQKPHTKIYNEERERPIMVLVDQSASQFFGSRGAFKSVRAAQLAAIFAWSALAQNDRVGGIIFSEKGHAEIKPARSRKTILRFLNQLCDFNQALSARNPVPETLFRFNQALDEAQKLIKPGTLVVLISDFNGFNPETEKSLSRISRHSELMLIRTYDPLEMQLPPPGRYPVSDGSHTLLIDALSSSNQQRYQDWAQQHRQYLLNQANRYRARFLEVATHEDPLQLLQQTLLQLGVR